jgi:DNA topoisomerase-3
VIEMAWFYRCEPQPDVEREDDCPMRFWKDTSGRYLDRATVAKLLKDGEAGPIDGFTARNGRTYKGNIHLNREEWQLKVKSLGYNEGEGVSDQPEYDVNSDPLGRCPFEEECQVLESPRQFVCERTLKEEELGKDEERPKSCGFVMPRTVCKREITRDEALVYLKTGKTELLTDFTSRFGRPFAATLVLKENGRHGFEFQPRTGGRRGGAASDSDAQVTRKKTTRKKSPRKKTPRKKAASKKTASKKASRKRASPKQGTRKSGTSKRKPSSSAGKPARPRKDG